MKDKNLKNDLKLSVVLFKPFLIVFFHSCIENRILFIPKTSRCLFFRYATEVDVDFVRKSVRAIGRCAIKVEV